MTWVESEWGHRVSRETVRQALKRLGFSWKKAKALLNWEPRVSLEQGLEQTLAWLQENVEHYQARGYVV